MLPSRPKPSAPPRSSIEASPQASNPYAGLSTEIWAIILNFLSPSALKEVCCVSKRLYNIALPVLLGDVNLTIPKEDEEGFEEAAPEVVHAYIQQYRFLRLMLTRPEYAIYVRRFTWSLQVRLDLQLPIWIDDERRTNLHSRVFTVFQKLTNVQFLDLDIRLGDMSVLETRKPTTLFPKAEHITLGGMAPQSLITAILAHRGQKPLKTLTITTLFQTRENPTDANDSSWHDRHRNIITGPGLMLGHLCSPALIARCNGMEYLSLSKVGTWDPLYHSSMDTAVLGTRDGDLCSAWAAFAREVKPKTLVLRNEREPLGDAYRCSVRDLPSSIIFEMYALKTLRKGWEGLERLELHGIGVDEEALRRAMTGVEVVMTLDVVPCPFLC